MCDTNESIRRVPMDIYSFGKTCVFWDVEDYPLPNGLDPASFYQSIREAIKKLPCDKEVLIHAYVDKNTFPDELRRKYSDAGIKFEVFTEGGKLARNWSMYADIMLWALTNPLYSNVIIIAKIIKDDIAKDINCLSTFPYGVLFSEAKQEWNLPVERVDGFLTEMFDGGNLSGSSQHKRKLADTLFLD